MNKKNTINYSETFMFPDIPWQTYPVYSVSESGKVYNLKSVLYPSPGSKKKFTRAKQLGRRSMQAKFFDMLINIGYWKPLTVIPEFPIIIQNSRRIPGVTGGYYLIDYYFPELRLAVELDSELHSAEADKSRDLYLSGLGVQVYRISNLEKPAVQKSKFPGLLEKVRSIVPEDPIPFCFLDNIRDLKPL